MTTAPICVSTSEKNLYFTRLFGKETKGLPEWLLKKYLDTKTIRIPMLPTLRSLNLSNSVCIIAYEILRQKNFENMQEISQYFDE